MPIQGARSAMPDLCKSDSRVGEWLRSLVSRAPRPKLGAWKAEIDPRRQRYTRSWAREHASETANAFVPLSFARAKLGRSWMDIPSHCKFVHSHLSKSPPFIEVNGSSVIVPYRKPNAPNA